MGSLIEINDTLQLTKDQGFPSGILNLESHQQNPIPLNKVTDQIFEFKNKEGARIFHPAPTRCFLVENRAGKWIYWGQVIIIEQTILSGDKGNQMTSGKFKITKLYDPEYQKQVTKNESPEGKSYF